MQLQRLVLMTLLWMFASAGAADEIRWWKGNTHTHSWWSDGDAPPEVIAKWYKENNYDFLVLSDHNIMQVGEKWYSIDNPPRRKEQIQKAYDTYLKQFGDHWVETRTIEGERQVKLKTLDEFRSLFEEPGEFIFIKGEEITDRYQNHPVHMNGVNLVEFIPPQGGNSVVNTIQNNLNAVVAQSKQYGQPMVAHLNHPNFHYAQTAEDFFYLDHEPGAGFFEMYNGHPHVHNHGNELHPSAERMWDIVLAKRLGELNRSLIYGVAVDDAHEYTRWGIGATNPGRGWIMVQAMHLTPNAITDAIKQGNFYNSSGISFKTIRLDEQQIDVEIAAERGVNYTIEFVGTERSTDLSAKTENVPHEHEGKTDHHHQTVHRFSEDIGKVLQSVKGKKASYRVTGNEIYVRVRVISDKPHPNPHAEGDLEMAWSQPLVVNPR
jgi:hypothetical protein